MNSLRIQIVFALLVFGPASFAQIKLDVREHGAKGDGATLDTKAIQSGIESCAAHGGGQVVFPPGRYLSGTIRLRSKVTLHLEAGARLIGTTNLTEYSQPIVPAYMPEAKWGKWHRGLIVAESAEDIAIKGRRHH